jgi:hypothetical protein
MAKYTNMREKKLLKLVIMPNSARNACGGAVKFLCKLHKIQHFCLKIVKNRPKMGGFSNFWAFFWQLV